MKNCVLFTMVLLMFSCGGSKQKQATEEAAVEVFSVEELMAVASGLVDQQVTVSGTVSHVCKHGGQRCFLMGDSDEVIIRVEAGDEIGAFKQEHMGSDLQVTGILRLVPIDEEYVQGLEGEDHDVHHALGYHGAGKTGTEEEMAKIAEQQKSELKEQVKAAPEGYVPVYYIDGLSFVELEAPKQE